MDARLPAPPPDFTRRAAAIETLARRMLAASLAVTVIAGRPGVGTTALAVKPRAWPVRTSFTRRTAGAEHRPER